MILALPTGAPDTGHADFGGGAHREVKDMHGDTPLSWTSWHLRPASILRLLCYGEFSVHPDNRSSYDHGTGWEQPAGRPHV